MSCLGNGEELCVEEGGSGLLVLQTAFSSLRPGARIVLANLACFHLQSRVKIVPSSLPGREALSVLSTSCSGAVLRNPSWAFLLVFEDSPPYSLPLGEPLFTLGLVSFGFAIPVFLFSLKAFLVGCSPMPLLWISTSYCLHSLFNCRALPFLHSCTCLSVFLVLAEDSVSSSTGCCGCLLQGVDRWRPP